MKTSISNPLADEVRCSAIGALETELRAVLASLRTAHLVLAQAPDPQGLNEAALIDLIDRREAIGRKIGAEVVRLLASGVHVSVTAQANTDEARPAER